MRAKLKAIKKALRMRMHEAIPEQGRWLRQVVTGFFNYHAVPTNSQALATFLRQVRYLWWRTLHKRSDKDAVPWSKVDALARDWLPKPRILHPWPSVRFARQHPRWEPYA